MCCLIIVSFLPWFIYPLMILDVLYLFTYTHNGEEYIKIGLIEFMNSNGILHQIKCPYSPQQNGVVERNNRHILEVTRSHLIDGNVPSHLWGEVVSSAVYLINRTPSSVLKFRRPLDVLSDHCIFPSMVYLLPHVFLDVLYLFTYTHINVQSLKNELSNVFLLGMDQFKKVIVLTIHHQINFISLWR